MRIFTLKPGDLHVHRRIDGHPFGVVFDDALQFERRFQNTCLDLWGFGGTEETAISNLFAVTEEWNAVHKNQILRFVRPGTTTADGISLEAPILDNDGVSR